MSRQFYLHLSAGTFYKLGVNMPQGIELRAEELRTLAFGSISGTYTLIQSALDKPARLLLVQNLTDALLIFSFDGIIDHFVLPASGFLLLDVMTNKLNDNGFFISRGSAISVKDNGSAATTGSVYLTSLYAKGS